MRTNSGYCQPLSSQSVISWSRTALSNATATTSRRAPHAARSRASRCRPARRPRRRRPSPRSPSPPWCLFEGSRGRRRRGRGLLVGLGDEPGRRGAQAVAQQRASGAGHARGRTRRARGTRCRRRCAPTREGARGARRRARTATRTARTAPVPHADAAVREHGHRERRLRRSEEELLALQRIERQPARRAAEDHEDEYRTAPPPADCSGSRPASGRGGGAGAACGRQCPSARGRSTAGCPWCRPHPPTFHVEGDPQVLAHDHPVRHDLDSAATVGQELGHRLRLLEPELVDDDDRVALRGPPPASEPSRTWRTSTMCYSASGGAHHGRARPGAGRHHDGVVQRRRQGREDRGKIEVELAPLAITMPARATKSPGRDLGLIQPVWWAQEEMRKRMPQARPRAKLMMAHSVAVGGRPRRDLPLMVDRQDQPEAQPPPLRHRSVQSVEGLAGSARRFFGLDVDRSGELRSHRGQAHSLNLTLGCRKIPDDVEEGGAGPREQKGKYWKASVNAARRCSAGIRAMLGDPEVGAQQHLPANPARGLRWVSDT